MKIILSLLDTPAFGGAEQYLLSHLYELAQHKNTHVILFTREQTVKNRVVEDGNKIEVRHLPYRLDAIGNWKGLVKYFVHAPIAFAWFLVTLLKLSKKAEELIVYTPGFSDRMLFSPFIKLFGYTLVWIEFGPLKPIFKRNWGFPKLLYTIGSPFPDLVVTISQHVKQSILHDSAIPKQKIKILYPAAPKITTAQLDRIKKEGQLWRAEKKLDNKRIVTFVGRLASEKEVDLLIKAFKQVTKEHKKSVLVIVGDGPEREDYALLVKKLGLSDKVLFTGFVSEEVKQQILATSDVFVFPGAWELEGFGMTTIEAMMLEVPVITSGHGPQQEIIDNQKTGLFFEPHTSKALAEKINTLLSRQKMAEKLAIAGRKKVLTKFTNVSLESVFSNLR